MTTNVFTRGETLVVALENMDGVDAHAVRAAMRRRHNGLPGGAPAGDVIWLTTEVVDVLGPGLGAGWRFTLEADATALLEVGAYALDARLSLGGSIEITEAITVTIRAGSAEAAG